MMRRTLSAAPSPPPCLRVPAPPSRKLSSSILHLPSISFRLHRPATYYYKYYDDPPPPRRVIRYYQYYTDPGEEVVAVRPRARIYGPNGSCDGESCVYARW